MLPPWHVSVLQQWLRSPQNGCLAPRGAEPRQSLPRAPWGDLKPIFFNVKTLAPTMRIPLFLKKDMHLSWWFLCWIWTDWSFFRSNHSEAYIGNIMLPGDSHRTACPQAVIVALSTTAAGFSWSQGPQQIRGNPQETALLWICLGKVCCSWD